MENNKILIQQRGGVLILELNNPSKLNCMGFEMLNQLDEALTGAEKSESVKVVIIKGAGDRAFSTGADLKEFKGLSAAEEVKWIELGNSVFDKLEALGKPTIAFIDGYAMGGGLELALACDIRVGTSRTVLSSPELQHGWLPGWGGMKRLRRLFGESVAKEVIFLCERINAEKALHWGILNRIVESETSDELQKVIDHLLSVDTSVFAMAKKAIAGDSGAAGSVDL